MVIVPSALNVLIVTAMVIVAGFLIRTGEMFFAGTAAGNGLAVLF